MNGKIAVAVALAIGLFGGVTLAAREEAEYPHGDYEAECSLCHGDEGWRPARVSPEFRHTSRFPLTGAHGRLECVACHESLEFARVSDQCSECHADVHREEFGSDCARCHSTRSFIDRISMVQFHQGTRFPLRGSHRSLDCEDCHTLVPEGQLQYVNRSTDCSGCHIDAYQGTTSPDHSSLGFPTDCEECHTPILWDLTPGSFDHASVGGLACETCHINDFNASSDPNHLQYGLPTDCMLCHSGTKTWDIQGGFDHSQVAGIDCQACHQDDYDATTDPSHTVLTLPTDCTLCHSSTTSWTIPGGFDHSVVAGRACEACHLSDYQATTDPNHQAANFPTDCMACHTSTTTWLGATFDHDGMYFPIYSGKHNGKWSDCSDCHTNPSNYAVFSCIDCHEHSNKSKVDDDHSGVSGYTYESNACFNCHPQGRN